MEVNTGELPFREPRGLAPPVPTEHIVIALSDPDDYTICLNSLAQDGIRWEEERSVELRCEAIIVHETLHALLTFIGETDACDKLNGSWYCPIDNWLNDYAISRPIGVTYPAFRGFWRIDD